jgi:integral membrane protein
MGYLYRVQTDIGRFRLVSLLEGVSYVALLGIAMPLKYAADAPGAVRIAGMIHGVLFLLFCATLFSVATNRDWKPKQIATAVIAALLPLGAFWLEHRLRRSAS